MTWRYLETCRVAIRGDMSCRRGVRLMEGKGPLHNVCCHLLDPSLALWALFWNVVQREHASHTRADGERFV